jgi:hypothetical protein
MTDLYTEILRFKKMSFNRDVLIENYASAVVEGMDLDSLIEFAYDTIVESLDNCSDEELLEEVERYDPELIEEIDPM